MTGDLECASLATLQRCSATCDVAARRIRVAAAPRRDMAILALVVLAAASAAEVDTVVDPRGGASSPAAETDASAELGEAAAAPRKWRPKLSFSIASFRSLLAKKQKKCNPKRDTSCCRAPRRALATLPAPATPCAAPRRVPR